MAKGLIVFSSGIWEILEILGNEREASKSGEEDTL